MGELSINGIAYRLFYEEITNFQLEEEGVVQLITG